MTSSMRMRGKASVAAASSAASHLTNRTGGGDGNDRMSPGRMRSGSVRNDTAAMPASTSMTMAVMLACESHWNVRSTMTSSLHPALGSPCCSCAMVTSGSRRCCPCACASALKLLTVFCICRRRLAETLHLLLTASRTLLQNAASSAE